MRLYEGTIQQFKEDVLENKIADLIKLKFEEYYKRKTNPREFRAWDISLTKLKEVFEIAKLSENKIVLEYELPFSEKRIDVILFGKDKKENENIIIIELKQWSNENVTDSEDEGNVLVNYGNFIKQDSHPCLQVEGYYWHLKDYMTIFEEEKPPFLSACVYCHNYNKGEKEVLFLPKFQKNLNEYPLFSKQEVKELGEYLKEKLSNGKGLEVLQRFDFSILKPSKKLLEHTGEMINHQQIFHLIDEQITSYKTIMSKAKKLSKSKEKSVIIVPGGPGTGKSVIALEIMGELLRSGINVYHATGSSAFTNTLRKILGVRAQERFKFFYGFNDRKDGEEVDVLICDEAHRIRKDSSDFRVPGKYRSKNPQIDDLIKHSKLSVFFIDEHQIVRPNEIGSISLIKNSALKFGANVYEMPELKTQFRCGGSGKYLEWIEEILQIRENGENIDFEEENKMKFEIVDSPYDLKEKIDEKNKEKNNSARIVAGFCWPWSNPKNDGSLVNDVKIGDFEMPWERKNQFWKWATDNSGMEQIGTVYTSQGFEFDYIGVIFGNDLIYNKLTKKFEAKPQNSHDIMVTRNNDKLIEHFKNVYRVLLSRAHKGVYVYFMDKDTEEYFKSKIKKFY